MPLSADSPANTEAPRTDRNRKEVCGHAMEAGPSGKSYIWKGEQRPHHAPAIYNQVLASSSEWEGTPSRGSEWTYLLF